MALIDQQAFLTQYGLLCHTFTYNELPQRVKTMLGDANQSQYQDCFLSLIANAGPVFWTALKTKHPNWRECDDAGENPVDYFSIKIVEQMLKITGLSSNAEVLYPGNVPAPLIALGELANWSTPSPLGLGLHSRYGPWFAYRALLKTTSPLQHNETTTDSIISPCLSCVATPCVNACPANAVSTNTRFDIGLCANFRVSDESTCRTQCHARSACPVGLEYRYTEEQSAYHMTHALKAVVKWAGQSQS